MTTEATSKSISPDFWVGLFSPLVLAAWLTPVVLMRAWALTVMWGWYIVPAFGAQPLRIVFAFGIAMIAAALTRTTRVQEKDSKFRTFVMPLIDPLLMLAFGWVGSLFV